MSIIPNIQTSNFVSGLDVFPKTLVTSPPGASYINGPAVIGNPALYPVALLTVSPFPDSPVDLINALTMGVNITCPNIGTALQVLGGTNGIIVTGGTAVVANGLSVFNGATTINGAHIVNAAELENGAKVTNSVDITNGPKFDNGSIKAPTADIPIVNGYCTGNKSFDIPHWKKKEKRIRHVCAEGPEAGIYIRGKMEGNIIDLPEYWDGLVDPETITVTLTAFGRAQNLYVKEIQYGRRVIIANEDGSMPNCHYEVWVARWIDPRDHDEKLHVVYDGKTPDDYPGNKNFLIGGWDYDRRNSQWEDSSETGSGA